MIEAEGRKAVALPGDLRDEAFCGELVARAVEELGGLDILVSNAPRQQTHEPVLDVSSEDFDATMKTNFYAPLWIIKAAMPHLPPGSVIIGTTSEQATEPSANLYYYAHTTSSAPPAAAASPEPGGPVRPPAAALSRRQLTGILEETGDGRTGLPGPARSRQVELSSGRGEQPVTVASESRNGVAISRASARLMATDSAKVVAITWDGYCGIKGAFVTRRGLLEPQPPVFNYIGVNSSPAEKNSMAADPDVVATRKTTHLTPPIGTRVWIVGLGVSGRVQALAQGGLTCRVQLDNGMATHECRNGDLLLLSD